MEGMPCARVATHGAPDLVLCPVRPAAAGRQLQRHLTEAAGVPCAEEARLPQLAR